VHHTHALILRASFGLDCIAVGVDVEVALVAAVGRAVAIVVAGVADVWAATSQDQFVLVAGVEHSLGESQIERLGGGGRRASWERARRLDDGRRARSNSGFRGALTFLQEQAENGRLFLARQRDGLKELIVRSNL